MKRTMRRLPLTMVCCLVVGGVAACSGENSAQKAPTTLNAVMSEEASDLNPFKPTQQGKSQILSTITMPALYVDANGKIASKMLKTWKVSEDAKTVTMTLKPNLEWSDGKPLTSADIAMSLALYLNPKISSNAGRVGAVVGEEDVAKGKSKLLSGVSTPNDTTLTVKLVNPDASWLAKFALLGAYCPVLPSHILGDVAPSKIASHNYFKKWPVTSGPFKLAKFVQGQYVKVDRNPNWSLGRAKFEHVIFQVLSTDQMTAKLQTGELHYIYTVDPADVDRVKKIEGATVASHRGVAPEVLGLNNAAPELKDTRVRQAMLYAIDRAGICKKILAGHCTVPLTNLRQIGPKWAIPSSELTEYEYNPTKAKQLLKEAGWDPKTKLTFLVRSDRSYVDKAVTAAVGQMREVGLNVQIRKPTTAQLLESIGKKTGWHGFWVSGADFVVDPDQWADYLRCSTRYPNGPNTAQYCDPKVDKLLEKGLRTTDQEKRADYYHEAFTRVNKNPGEIYLYVVDTIVAYNSQLTGVTVSGNLNGGYWDIGNWGWKQ